MSAIYKALVKAQAEMNKAIKDSTNPHFKSKYADLESCNDAVKPSLASNGLGYIQICHDVADAVCVETVIIHESGEQLTGGKVVIPVNRKDAQAYGSALTYARRYSLSTTFGLSTEDDDGNRANQTPPPQNKVTAQPTKHDSSNHSEALKPMTDEIFAKAIEAYTKAKTIEEREKIDSRILFNYELGMDGLKKWDEAKQAAEIKNPITL